MGLPQGRWDPCLHAELPCALDPIISRNLCFLTNAVAFGGKHQLLTSARDEDQVKHGGLARLRRGSWQVAATWGPAKIRRL